MLQGLEPGWRTHLMFAAFDGLVQEAADHLVVRTPASPLYYWGNFLLYPRLATDADLAPWMRDFELEIAGPQPESRHVAFGMHAEAAQWTPPPAFAAAGFEAHATTTLTLRAGQLRPDVPAPHGDFELRPLALPAEADLAVALSVATDEGDHEVAGYRSFRQAQMRRYGAMAAAGMGHWYGAFHGGQLVAGLGLFGRDGVGRYQHVETHAAWRRRGLCRALVHAAARDGLQRMGWHTLVMCADPDDVAIGIYASLGFQRRSTQWSLERRSPADAAAAA